MAAYRAALDVYTREDLPFRWAKTEQNLGLALTALARREQGTTRLGQAAAPSCCVCAARGPAATAARRRSC